jgi:SAM-dependent methyltransferase
MPEPHYTRLRNLKLFSWMNDNAPGKRVLNLGSGVGLFDKYLSNKIKMINLDIDTKKPNIHIVADAQSLPFKNGVFDIVYSIAVLEHVKKPWIAADEIYRILCRGGHVVVDLPFLNIIHDYHDYFRFTDKGIKSLFDKEKFECIFEQVGSGGGSFLSVFILNYFNQFFWRFLRPFYYVLFHYILCLLKYIDIAIDKSESLRITANSFDFIGKKI